MPIRQLSQRMFTLMSFAIDVGKFVRLRLRSSAALAAENLFLRKRLALHEERQVKPGRASDVTRPTMVWLSRWFDWRPALRIVKPETFTRWHRKDFSRSVAVYDEPATAGMAQSPSA